jgi:excisionase family DNA binding protein
VPAVAQAEPAVPKLLYSLPELMHALGLSRETIDNLAASGEIQSRKVGRRRLYLARSVDDYIRRLEEAGPDR